MVVEHLDAMAKIKAVLPLALVLLGSAPQERREETVSSDAGGKRAANINGVSPFFVFGCKVMMMMMTIIMIDIDNNR